MPVLLDTCALSEYSQKVPSARALDYLENLDPNDTFISAVTLAEIAKGIELLPPSRKKRNLEIWFRQEVLLWYSGRILPFDQEVALQWSPLAARLILSGLSMAYADPLIAATALAHGMPIVTRNEADFAHAGARIINPWT